MPQSRNMRRQYRVEFGEDRLRTLEIPAASRSRPVGKAVERTGSVIRHRPHRARPRSRLRLLSIDPSRPTARRALQRCEFQDRRPPVFRADPTPLYIAPSPGAAPPFRCRSLALNIQPRTLDREARLLPRIDGNVPRAARGCRAFAAEKECAKCAGMVAKRVREGRQSRGEAFRSRLEECRCAKPEH
jgi:hypothetical protein